MKTYKFGVDFKSDGGALTLCPSILGADAEVGVEKTYTNPSGWEVTAIIREDYYHWINDFKATHPTLGIVEGDFENEVLATSKEAFDHFLEHHKPEAWDYQDI